MGPYGTEAARQVNHHYVYINLKGSRNVFTGKTLTQGRDTCGWIRLLGHPQSEAENDREINIENLLIHVYQTEKHPGEHGSFRDITDYSKISRLWDSVILKFLNVPSKRV